MLRSDRENWKVIELRGNVAKKINESPHSAQRCSENLTSAIRRLYGASYGRRLRPFSSGSSIFRSSKAQLFSGSALVSEAPFRHHRVAFGHDNTTLQAVLFQTEDIFRPHKMRVQNKRSQVEI